MRTILIVDDEPLIVTGLSSKVDWTSIGCEVVGTAYNGLDAMAKIDSLNPDILLTDIVMAGMTGLELAAYLQSQRRHTRVILISTYDNFEYALEGLRMGVTDYILKPIDIDQLMAAVRKAVTLLEAGEREQLEGSDMLTRRECLFEIAQHGVAAVSKESRDNCPRASRIIVFFKLYRRDGKPTGPQAAALREELRGALKAEGIRSDVRVIGGVVVAIHTMSARRQQERVMAQAREVCRRQSDAETICTAAASDILDTLEALRGGYMDCMAGIRQTYFAKQGGVTQTRAQEEAPGVQQEMDGMRSALQSGDLAAFEQAFFAMAEKLRAGGDADHAAHMLREVQRMAMVAASRLGIVERPENRNAGLEELFDSQCAHVLAYARQICVSVQQMQNTAGKLRLLMQENFARSDFGLAELAQRLGVSPSYLSRLFKKEIGENFQDALVNMRIAKAQALLRDTTLKHNEIARRVGFEDERYFGQVFRRRTGETPGNYRRLAQQNNEQKG